jgi:lactoylglutathione lyase
MQSRIVHCNINVTDREKSIAFYEKALGLRVAREKTAADGSFILTYLGDGESSFLLELTWLRDHTQPYELGENESHIAFAVKDMQAAHDLHEQMGCICYENPGMGIYFIHDPDDYWLEIVPER